MPTDNHMHRFIVELSHHDYETIDSTVEGTVADEIAQVIIEYLPALKVAVTPGEGVSANCDICGKRMNLICRGCGNELQRED